MRQSDCPCYRHGLDCEKRHIGCHADCTEYRQWKKKLDEKNEVARKEKARHQTMSEAAKRKVWRKQRYRNQLKPFRRDTEQ